MSFLCVLVSLGRVFHRPFRKFVSGLVIFLSVTRCGDAVGVRGKIMELGGSLVPVVSAKPAMVAPVASVAHESLLFEIKLNSTMPISLSPYPTFRRENLSRLASGVAYFGTMMAPGSRIEWKRICRTKNGSKRCKMAEK